MIFMMVGGTMSEVGVPKSWLALTLSRKSLGFKIP